MNRSAFWRPYVIVVSDLQSVVSWGGIPDMRSTNLLARNIIRYHGKPTTILLDDTEVQVANYHSKLVTWNNPSGQPLSCCIINKPICQKPNLVSFVVAITGPPLVNTNWNFWYSNNALHTGVLLLEAIRCMSFHDSSHKCMGQMLPLVYSKAMLDGVRPHMLSRIKVKLFKNELLSI